MRVGYSLLNLSYQSQAQHYLLTHSRALSMIHPEIERVEPQIPNCPANLTRFQKLFLVRSPIDFTIKTYKHELGDRIIFETNVDQGENCPPMILVREDTKTDTSIWLTVHIGILLLSDESVVAEVLPAFLHGNPLEISMGAFDISKWQRTVDITFKYTFGEDLVIKVGDPLYYLSFQCEDLNERITLDQIPLTSEILVQQNICSTVKQIKPKGSWNIATGLGNKFRPNNFLPKLKSKWKFWK